MSFELVDNLLQVVILGVASFVALLMSVRRQRRTLLMLALGYGTFAMGTLYYVLFLAVTGHVPHVFYVSEFSWVAAYYFFLSVELVRVRGLGVRPAPLPALCLASVVVVVLAERMMGPSVGVCASFAAALGSLAYLTVFRLRSQVSHRRTDVCLLLCVVLQLLVYLSSDFVEDYTGFNLYFAFDLLLTAGLVALIPLVLGEEVAR